MKNFFGRIRLKKVGKVLSQEPRLIEIEEAKRVIFVGDTHGDLVASQKVIANYLKPENKIVFLGDYVDRGPHSKENLNFLLKAKFEWPDQIYLLQGNHEGYQFFPFSPADFWRGLNEKEFELYSSIVETLPLAAVVKDIIVLHGALPEIRSLEEINEIVPGTEKWLQITWGDFNEKEGGYLGKDPLTGRPQFGKDYFFKLMERFKKNVLIRSHQPDSPQFMFEDRCLTIFSSSAYTRGRTIAIFDFEKEIRTARDLDIITI